MAEAAGRELRALWRSGTAAGMTDGEALRRAAGADAEDAEAFLAAIVERHGAMVLRVCRGALGDGADADDAFQAVFLVLARRIHEAGRLESVGGWLRGVAVRTAARARVAAARRRRLDRRAARPTAVAAAPPDLERDRAVQEEVGRLPSRYREVVILCFWEGLPQEQAADRLGRPVVTVRSRSARARELLRRRLAARGLAPDGLDAPPPTVPPALALAAARGAAEAVAGRSIVTVASLYSMELSRQIARSMLMSRIAPIAAAAALTLAATIGIGRARGWQEPNPAPAAHDERARAAGPEERPPATDKAEGKSFSPLGLKPNNILIVKVLKDLPGRPISDQYVVRKDGKISLGIYGEVEVAGLTVAEAKEKVVERLREAMSDEDLGLIKLDDLGRRKVVSARDTDRVFVKHGGYIIVKKKPAEADKQADGGAASPGPVPAAAAAPNSEPDAPREPALGDVLQRLDRIEARLDLLLKRLEE